MNILNRFTKVLFEKYYKDDDAFIAGFVARNILGMIVLFYLANIYIIAEKIGLTPDNSRSTLKDQKTVVIFIFIAVRILIEFATKSDKYFEECLASEESRSNYDDKYDLVWIGVIGLTIFFILISL